jgi:hypothetical protein
MVAVLARARAKVGRELTINCLFTVLKSPSPAEQGLGEGRMDAILRNWDDPGQRCGCISMLSGVEVSVFERAKADGNTVGPPNQPARRLCGIITGFLTSPFTPVALDCAAPLACPMSNTCFSMAAAPTGVLTYPLPRRPGLGWPVLPHHNIKRPSIVVPTKADSGRMPPPPRKSSQRTGPTRDPSPEAWPVRAAPDATCLTSKGQGGVDGGRTGQACRAGF